MDWTGTDIRRINGCRAFLFRGGVGAQLPWPFWTCQCEHDLMSFGDGSDESGVREVQGPSATERGRNTSGISLASFGLQLHKSDFKSDILS